MNINNPGILDGAVTTAKLAAGAVTTAKCSTSDFAPTITGAISVDGNIEIETNVYPSLILANASAVEHWRLQENSGGGAQDTLQISNRVSGHVPLACLTDDTVSLYSPLPVSSGGTGAASLVAAAIPELLAHNSNTGLTGAHTDTLIASVGTTGLYRVMGQFHTINAGTGALTLDVKYTVNGDAVVYSFDVAATPGGEYTVPFDLLVPADAGTSIAVSCDYGYTYELYDTLVRLT